MESGQARVPFMPEAEDMTPGQVHALHRQVGKNVMKIPTSNIFPKSSQDWKTVIFTISPDILSL